MVAHSHNFGFLVPSEESLSRLGFLAERSFHDDPPTALLKLRQFAELIARRIADSAGAISPERETFEELLRRLSQRQVLPRQAADALHHLRKLGNAAAHENLGSHAQALTGLKVARQLGIWFHRVYCGQPDFAPGPFVPPLDPPGSPPALSAEIAELRDRLAAAEGAAEAARRQSEEFARDLHGRLAAESEEKAFWERYAAEADAARSAAEARAAHDRSREPLDRAPPQALHRAETALTGRPDIAQSAAELIEIDESDTRIFVDEQLREMGWEADWMTLRYAEGSRPTAKRALAIAEWPTESGPVDYALFVDGRCVGVIEAKRSAVDVPAALEQAKRYARGVVLTPAETVLDAPFGRDLDGGFRVPFVFATNGRPYLKQLATKSGIWFLDVRSGTRRPVALPDWFTPRDLEEKLEQQVSESVQGLREEPFEYAGLWPHQRDAVRAVEEAIARGRREMLVEMATGTGKTLTCIALMYRLLKHKRFRRVLFLVDRTTLAKQALTAFETTEMEGLLKFAQIYNIAGLGTVPERHHRVHVATVQSLVRRLFDETGRGPRPSPGLYDLVIVDEAHRGYVLDAEMREGDIAFRDTEDYLSKYRRVIEHFDAVRIALTATPALHTTQIFGEPVFTYGYRQGVVDGWLIDYRPPRRIVTALSLAGITFSGGEEVNVLDTRTGRVDLFTTPDEVEFEIDTFNTRVLTREFNRVVAERIAAEVPPDAPGKTLLFAARDDHADILVDELRKALEARYGPQPHGLVAKITGSVDRSSDLILRYRNDAEPKYVATVDLLTTGVDLPPVTTLVFVRRVNSRILYEQMMGRATRRCDAIGKTEFRVFDAVDLYANLQAVSTMRPVVVQPDLSFAILLDDLARAPAEEDRAAVRDQIVVRLRQRLRRMTESERAAFAGLAGQDPEGFLDAVRAGPPQAAAALFAGKPALVAALDGTSAPAPDPLYISEHPDSLVRVEDVFGPGVTPEDYLSQFEAFVRGSMNTLPGLVAATQRPRELTRKDLKDLARTLDGAGFSEAKVRAAYGRVRNADIAAHILGFVRQAAIGDPLVPYADRVDRAVAAFEASRSWSPKQLEWLRRIARALKETPVGDREILEGPAFRQYGGWRVADRDFDATLEAVLKDLTESIWSKPAA